MAGGFITNLFPISEILTPALVYSHETEHRTQVYSFAIAGRQGLRSF